MATSKPSAAPQPSWPATLDTARLPQHVAIIMDGNGRWARQRGGLRLLGHKAAIEAVRDTIEGTAELGIPYLTLFAFSTENWQRPKQEVEGLMSLLVSTLRKEVPTLIKNNIRLKAIGQIEDLPAKTRHELQDGIARTAHGTRLTLTLALSYGARADLLRAAQRLAAQAASGQIRPEAITEAHIRQQLSTADIPDPELLIRTSGEHRISNFLLWELAYTEICILQKFWPDFRRQDLHQALLDFQQRERRFGKTSEQLQPETLTEPVAS